MTFVKDDHSYWQCDRCGSRLDPIQGEQFKYLGENGTVKYHLIKTGPLVSIAGSDVLSDYCETCANEILAECVQRNKKDEELEI
jgi:hypothetical protein